MAEATQWTSRSSDFSGRVLDVFAITGQGVFALVEDPTGKPRAGQRLEVVSEDTVLGTVVLSGLEQVERFTEGNVLALRFKSTPDVQLEPGQVLRTPVQVREGPRDDFTRHLSAFAAGIGWATLIALVVLVGLVAAQRAVAGAPFNPPLGTAESWNPEYIKFTLWFARLVSVMAAIWLTALLWLRRLLTT